MILVVIGFDIKGAGLTWLVGSVAKLHCPGLTILYLVAVVGEMYLGKCTVSASLIISSNKIVLSGAKVGKI